MIECTESNLFKLASTFRNAIDKAYAAKEFDNVPPFDRFPYGCCGLISHLLAEFLQNIDIKTFYVSGCRYFQNPWHFQSHAWLKTENDIMIDITGDQFKNNNDFDYYSVPVYVGQINHFLSLFDIEDITVSTGLDVFSVNKALYYSVYKKIIKYL